MGLQGFSHDKKLMYFKLPREDLVSSLVLLNLWLNYALPVWHPSITSDECAASERNKNPEKMLQDHHGQAVYQLM